MLEIGDKVERYIVLSLLGEGGMAAVYKVEHDTLGTVHALKVLTLTSKSIRARLVNEGRVQAKLDHVNAVAVRDVLDVDGAPGLLMDFVDGPDLEIWLRDNTPSLEQAEALFRGIVAAVRAAHQQGLIHRDLKPANVLMAKDIEGNWVPKVADFGLAKAIGGDTIEGKTRSGLALGTPEFMAPEQIRDASTVDERADIFALGCILYQLTTGELAFQGADMMDTFEAVTQGKYINPKELAPSLPPRILNTITQSLKIDRDQRLKTCDDLLANLSGEQKVTVESRSPKSKPMMLALPVLALGALGAVAAFGVVFAGLYYLLASVPADNADPCGGRAGSHVGYIQTARVFFIKEGKVWILPGDKKVVARLPTDDHPAGATVCTLPRGSKITLVEPPTKLGIHGIWVAVVGGSYTVPEPEEPEE
ncbi:MAG: protein kinase [Rhodobacterales bacterium]|nr:protein kinase [Rhodobacterales bacterium]